MYTTLKTGMSLSNCISLESRVILGAAPPLTTTSVFLVDASSSAPPISLSTGKKHRVTRNCINSLKSQTQCSKYKEKRRIGLKLE